MWKKFFKFGGSDFKNILMMLINEIGVFKEFVEKVFCECNGDLVFVR